MSAGVYQIISITGFVLSVVCLVIAVILFFAFDIISIMGELSGKTAARQIAEIREKNRKQVSKRYVVEHFDKAIIAEKQTEASEETSLLSEETEQLEEVILQNDANDIETCFEIIESFEEIHTDTII